MSETAQPLPPHPPRAAGARAATGKGKPTIWRWQARYMQDGADGLFRDAPRRRAFAPTSPEQIAAVVERTLQEDPPAAMHWTLRSMAKASGLAPSTLSYPPA